MGPGSKLHHRDVIGVALRRMESELHSPQSTEVLADIQREISGGNGKRKLLPPEDAAAGQS